MSNKLIKIEPPSLVERKPSNPFQEIKINLEKEVTSEKKNSSTSEAVREHDFEFEETRVDVPCINNKIQTIRKCCYCRKVDICTNMTTVPSNPVVFDQWARILGICFYGNGTGVENALICKTHFETKWEGIRPKYILPIANSNRNYIETELDESVEKLRSKPKNYNRSEPSRVPYICAYCEKLCEFRNLTEVTKNHDLRMRWIAILGKKFEENLELRGRTFICRSHFKVQWGARRPASISPCFQTSQLTVKQEVNENASASVSAEISTSVIQIKQEELDDDQNFVKELLKCCYCEHQDILENMALVPRNKQGLTKWMKILGVEFYQNVMKNKHSYICRTHFNEQWSTLEIARKLLPVKNVEKVVEEQKPLIFLDDNTRSEFENRDIDNKEVVEKNMDSQSSCNVSDLVKQEEITIDGASEPKKIKIEVKNEDSVDRENF